jgi:hypothetical protein
MLECKGSNCLLSSTKPQYLRLLLSTKLAYLRLLSSKELRYLRYCYSDILKICTILGSWALSPVLSLALQCALLHRIPLFAASSKKAITYRKPTGDRRKKGSSSGTKHHFHASTMASHTASTRRLHLLLATGVRRLSHIARGDAAMPISWAKGEQTQLCQFF